MAGEISDLKKMLSMNVVLLHLQRQVKTAIYKEKKNLYCMNKYHHNQVAMAWLMCTSGNAF